MRARMRWLQIDDPGAAAQLVMTADRRGRWRAGRRIQLRLVPGGIEGTFDEREEWEEEVEAAALGRLIVVARSEVRSAEFVVREGPGLIEVSTRGKQPRALFAELNSIAGRQIGTSPVQVDPVLWFDELRTVLPGLVVEAVRTKKFPISAEVAGTIVLSGGPSVLDALRTRLPRAEVSTLGIRWTGKAEHGPIRFRIGSSGSASMFADNAEVLSRVRGALRQAIERCLFLRDGKLN